MWRMLQQDQVRDYVLATGETRTVREFVEAAYQALGREIVCRGQGVEEEGVDSRSGKRLIAINTRYFRPAEVEVLMGDPRNAEKHLGWHRQVDFPALVRGMAHADQARIARGAALQ